MKPHKTMLSICGYRRHHGSQGERAFIDNYLLPTLNTFDKPIQMDAYGNITVFNGNEDVLFVAHIDTVHISNDLNIKQPLLLADKILSLDLDKVNANNKPSCLGADDGAGIAILLYLLSKDVKGTYIFTRGEEVGGLGADFYSSQPETRAVLQNAKIAIEIDRRGVDEIIYSQGVGDCASEDFTQALCDELRMGHIPSFKGSYTDVATFANFVPECVNIAAGYYNAHTDKEYVDLNYLDTLAERLAQVDWQRLPIKRQAGDFGLSDIYGSYPYWGTKASADKPLNFNEITDLISNDPYVVACILENLGVTYGDVDEAYYIAEGLYNDDFTSIRAPNARY